MKNENREVPVNNYIFLGIIILVTILLLFYFYLWYLTYEESKLNNQIMDRYLQVINYNELEDYIRENKNSYVYVSVLEDKPIRNFEIKFKSTIIDNSLKKEILYLDLTEIYSNKNKLDKANKEYNIDNKNISNVPCILVFEEGSLIKIYDIKENNYDIEQLEEFFEEEGLDLDD